MATETFDFDTAMRADLPPAAEPKGAEIQVPEQDFEEPTLKKPPPPEE